MFRGANFILILDNNILELFGDVDIFLAVVMGNINLRLLDDGIGVEDDDIRILFGFEYVMDFTELLEDKFLVLALFFLYFVALGFEDWQMELFFNRCKSFYEYTLCSKIFKATSVSNIVHKFISFQIIFMFFLCFLKNDVQSRFTSDNNY